MKIEESEETPEASRPEQRESNLPDGCGSERLIK
jgi:hypothetical protein